MPWLDWYTLAGMGGFFILLGIIGFLWGSYEERTYYDSIAARPDVREFLDHLPWRPEPHAIIVGARIATIVGVALLLFAGAYWLWLR